MGIIDRLFQIARSQGGAGGRLRERIFKKIEKPFEGSTFRSRGASGQRERGREGESRTQGPGSRRTSSPTQLEKDLATFNLKPPSSMEEVRKARNREIKKYHSDRFMNDPDKLDASKQIMQILNSAYDRLKRHFESKGGR